jgi:hypothetical protein
MGGVVGGKGSLGTLAGGRGMARRVRGAVGDK